MVIFYIKRKFHLESRPVPEELIVTMPIISATIITTFFGPVSDWIDRQ